MTRSNTRLYTVSVDGTTRLVNAKSKAAARKFVTAHIAVDVADVRTVANLMAGGTKVEDATAVVEDAAE